MLTKPATLGASTADSHKLMIAATFTAEPLAPILEFWMDKLALPAVIEFAPYNQVFQQLLDPLSNMAQNHQGVNVILFRLEDWKRELGAEAQPNAVVQRNLRELSQAIQGAAQRASVPYLLVCCPDSPEALANPEWQTFCQAQEALLRAELGGVSGLYLVLSDAFTLYPVVDYYDQERDRLGHIPFTTLFCTALGTLLARRFYALKSAPHKVIVLDCDNTLWQGVVGEDGVAGIAIPPGWQALQDFMVNQQRQGMLLCLCSKNEEADVLEVFEKRQDMRLRKEHLVTWRINWLPKSQNLRMLAQELNLGLDSFIFIDDNPVECAEVRASCPEVLTLQLPVEGDIPTFLNHVWAFDHLQVTQEDQQRTQLYRQNLERDRLQKAALTFADFLASLELTITIAPPTPEQIPRVAQLTQRTNQFNFTMIRRSEGDITQLAAQGLECRVVQVRDRFGDYGLVGVMIFGQQAENLQVDTFLLSCRVLGRGVEYRMLSYLGEVAQERQLQQVRITLWRTQKNLPALNFLEKVAGDYQTAIEQGFAFALPVQVAMAVTFQPDRGAPKPVTEQPQPASRPSLGRTTWDKSEHLGQIARQWVTPA
ncbi:HAD-IIIC family phosphatase, partial [Trichothermofontia sp.]